MRWTTFTAVFLLTLLAFWAFGGLRSASPATFSGPPAEASKEPEPDAPSPRPVPLEGEGPVDPEGALETQSFRETAAEESPSPSAAEVEEELKKRLRNGGLCFVENELALVRVPETVTEEQVRAARALIAEAEKSIRPISREMSRTLGAEARRLEEAGRFVAFRAVEHGKDLWDAVEAQGLGNPPDHNPRIASRTMSYKFLSRQDAPDSLELRVMEIPLTGGASAKFQEDFESLRRRWAERASEVIRGLGTTFGT